MAPVPPGAIIVPYFVVQVAQYKISHGRADPARAIDHDILILPDVIFGYQSGQCFTTPQPAGVAEKLLPVDVNCTGDVTTALFPIQYGAVKFLARPVVYDGQGF